jgi:hypothetical protein
MNIDLALEIALCQDIRIGTKANDLITEPKI